MEEGRWCFPDLKNEGTCHLPQSEQMRMGCVIPCVRTLRVATLLKTICAGPFVYGFFMWGIPKIKPTSLTLKRGRGVQARSVGDHLSLALK